MWDIVPFVAKNAAVSCRSWWLASREQAQNGSVCVKNTVKQTWDVDSWRLKIERLIGVFTVCGCCVLTIALAR